MNNIRNTIAAVLSAAMHIIIFYQLKTTEPSGVITKSLSKGNNVAISVEMYIVSPAVRPDSEMKEDTLPPIIRTVAEKNAVFRQKLKTLRTHKEKNTHSQPAQTHTDHKLKATDKRNALANAPFNAHEGKKQVSTNQENATGNVTTNSTYLSRLRANIESKKCYPPGVRKKRGISVVSFELSDTGRIHSVILQRSSGYSALDSAAIVAVSQGGMEESPPPDVPRKMTISVRFDFN